MTNLTRDEMLQNKTPYTSEIRNKLVKKIERIILDMNDPEPYQIACKIVDYFFLNPER